jgi:hypothetical protein
VRDLFKDLGSAGGHRSAAKVVISLHKVRRLVGGSSQELIKKWVTKQFSKAVLEKSEELG